MAKPRRVIKRNSIQGPRQIENLWGKGERNEVFIMNFKEIHSNTEFLSTYRRARACSCRNRIKNYIDRKSGLNVMFKPLFYVAFCSGQYPRTAPARKIRNLSHFLEVSKRVEICNLTFSTRYKVLFGIVLIVFYFLQNLNAFFKSFVTLLNFVDY